MQKQKTKSKKAKNMTKNEDIIRQLVIEYNKLLDINQQIQKLQYKNYNKSKELNKNIQERSELVIIREIYDSIQL